MKKSIILVVVMVLGLSGVASALTYIDTPEGRRPVEGGEWFVTGTVDADGRLHEDLDEEWVWQSASALTIEYYLTSHISVRGATRWASMEGEAVTQPYYSVSLGSNLTDHLELLMSYDWTEVSGAQRNSIRVGLQYQHLNH